MAMTDYLETALLNHVLRNTAYTPPTTVYMALFTAAPTDAGGGTEVVGGSYARQAVAWNAPVAGASANTSAEQFIGMPACTVVAVGLYDALTAGNLLFHYTLGTPKTYVAGDTVDIAATAMSVTLD